MVTIVFSFLQPCLWNSLCSQHIKTFCTMLCLYLCGKMWGRTLKLWSGSKLKCFPLFLNPLRTAKFVNFPNVIFLLRPIIDCWRTQVALSMHIQYTGLKPHHHGLDDSYCGVIYTSHQHISDLRTVLEHVIFLYLNPSSCYNLHD